jgi:putative aldouronate transport system substrate-binding protein
LKSNPAGNIVTAPVPGIKKDSCARVYLPNATSTYLCISSKFKNPEVLFKIFNLGVEKQIYPASNEECEKYYGVAGKYTGFKLAIFNALSPTKNYDIYKKVNAAVAIRDASGLNYEQKQNYDAIQYYLNSPKADNPDSQYVTGWGFYKVFADPDCSYRTMDRLMKLDSFSRCLYTAPMTSLMGQKYPLLDKMAKETIIRILYGEPVDTYDTFLQNWRKLGGDEVTREANAWYDENIRGGQ